uniref:Large ribosomal subunit protein uL23c n=2 Tax=Roya TaxID=43942 RepID=A0A024B3W5_9VIRI|nr:ribosomal protein L23 [Roya anglica]YP_009256894.1 ribosomal protein L23 [Roya obtusa]AHZ11115.1 ribosomal protein L23 [Roya anglica]ANI25970.1 ribosomal protein L23 [Roya obtusa]
MIDYIKSPVLKLKNIRLLEKNQYTFDVDPKATKTEVKSWVEGFFGVKVTGMNSYRPPRKMKRMGPAIGYPVRYKRMIVTLRSGDSIPLF